MPAEVCLELCFTKMLGFLWCHGFDKIADIADSLVLVWHLK